MSHIVISNSSQNIINQINYLIVKGTKFKQNFNDLDDNLINK